MKHKLPGKSYRKSRAKSKNFKFDMLIILLLIIVAGSALSYYTFLHANQSQKYSPTMGIILPPSSTNVIKSVSAKSQYVTEYTTTSDAGPNAIALDSHGNVWFSLGSFTSIAELNPSNQTIHLYQLPEPKNTTMLSWGMTVDDSKGLVWFTDEISNSIWNFNTTDNLFTKYILPNARSTPYQIALDNVGNVWFTELDGGRLGRISTNGILQEFEVPLTSTYNLATRSTGPAGIAITKDGTIWFAESYGNSIGSFSPSGLAFKQYDLSSRGVSAPTGIAIDSHGDAWITQHGASFISEFDPITNQITTISSSVVGATASLPYFIQIDSLGNIWFNEHYGNAIGRYSPDNASLVEYEIPSRLSSFGNISGVLTLALSSHGEPWFTELYSGKIGTVNVSEPIDLGIRVSNLSGNVISFGGRSYVTLELSITNLNLVNLNGKMSLSENLIAVTLKSSVGSSDSEKILSLTFVKPSGYGNFTSQVTVYDNEEQTTHMLYPVTISAVSEQLIVSQVVQAGT